MNIGTNLVLMGNYLTIIFSNSYDAQHNALIFSPFPFTYGTSDWGNESCAVPSYHVFDDLFTALQTNQKALEQTK